eukprot:TRINITY_DN2083_c0_g3_i1.p1 TRINITY_DN2083_c0_g3~~TRINITY_DN2083_c0_g3_i1.p1  ORF type:complete len:463 (+),score=107.51 TRINITY_DN2083_c0_g3_i1:68-1390(+)
MDDDRTLGSYSLKAEDTLRLGLKKNYAISLFIMIKDHKALSCAWKISLQVRREAKIAEVISKITSRGSVNISADLVDKFDLALISGEELDRRKTIADYKIRTRDTLVLKRSEKSTFGPGVEVLTMDSIKLEQKIGQGTYGKVYSGLCFGTPVAIKVLKELPDQDQLNEIKHEINILSDLANTVPQIVRLYGFVEQPKKMCIVMELCSNGSLYHVMNAISLDFGWDRTLRTAIEFTKGMKFLHSCSPPIVHRDFKSLNILVTGDWQIKICDFGLSRRTSEDQQNTLRRLRSTAAFSPPELLNKQAFTPESDVYGMGITLWEMIHRCITGKYQRPYAEEKAIQFDYQIIVQAGNGKRPTIPSTTPDAIKDLLERCWNQEPEERPNCTQLLKELETLFEDYQNNVNRWDQVKLKFRAQSNSPDSDDSSSSLERLRLSFTEQYS